MHIASSRTRTGNFRFPGVSRQPLSYIRNRYRILHHEPSLNSFNYRTTKFHERFGSFTYLLGQKVSTAVTIAKIIKCLP